MNALRKSVLASLAAALFLVPSAAPAARFITGAVTGYPTGWTTTDGTPADSVTPTGEEGAYTGLAFSLGEGQLLTYQGSASESGGTADVVIDDAVFTVAYELPGADAVGGLSSQAAICVAQISPDTAPSFYGWVGGGTADALEWTKLAGANPPADGTPVDVTMSFDYTGDTRTVTFKVGNDTLYPATGTADDSAIALATSLDKVSAVSFSGEGSIAEMTGTTEPAAASEFLVSFFDEGAASACWSTSVVANTAPAYAGPAMSRQPTAQYTYEFAGWTNAASANQVVTLANETIVSVTNYYAKYTETLRKYTIKFEDDDHTEISSAQYDYGTAAADIVKPADPTKGPSTSQTFMFGGWSPAVAEVTGDATYTATYTASTRKYTVTFEDEDHTEISSAQYDYGTAAADIVKPADPTKADDNQNTYTFAGWDPEVSSVTGDQTYTATYTAHEIVAAKLSLARPTISSTVLASGTAGAQVKAAVTPDGTTVNGASDTTGVSVSVSGATATFTGLPWNEAVDWTLSAGDASLPGRFYAKGETEWFNVETTDLADVEGLAAGMKGVEAETSSAADQMVRFQTSLEIPEGAMEELPTGDGVGSARTGFAVAQIAGNGDTAPAFYAFNGSTWDKLLGVAPAANTTVDLLIVLDVEDGTARYYVDGIALYKDNAGARTYAIPMGSSEDNAIHGIGFANPDGVKAPVVAEYDEPFEAAVGDVPYAAAAAGASAVAKDGTETLQILANLDPGVEIALASGQSVKVKAGTFTGLTVATSASGKMVRSSEPDADGVVTYDLVDSEATIIWLAEDGETEIDRQTLAIGAVPVYAGGAEGTNKTATAQFTYTFAGWTAGGTSYAPGVALPAVVAGGATYTASFTETLNSYEITWADHSGTVKTETVEYGKTPTAPSTTPAQYVEDGKIYTGTWPTPVAVTGPVTYKADYNTGVTAAATVISVAQDGTETVEGTYATLAEAFAAAQDGQTVRLLADVALTDRLFVNAGATPAYAGSGNRYATTSEDKAVTLDLNGHDITSASNIALAGGSLNITNSSATAASIATTNAGLAPVEIRGTGDLAKKRTLTVGKNVILDGGEYGLNVFGSNDAQKNLIDVTVDGTVNGTLFVLGNLTNAENEIDIVVNGTVAAPAGSGDNVNVGIALNGYADVTVNKGASVSGDSGIEVRAGTLTVNGGTIEATADAYSYKANGSGSSVKGAAVAVSQHSTRKAVEVSLGGGTFTGPVAVAVVDPETGDPASVAVALTGGTFDGDVVVDASAASVGAIIPATVVVGGETVPNPARFSDADADGVPADYKLVADGKTGLYKIEAKVYVAEVDGQGYETLAEAVAAVPEDGTETTITMIADETINVNGYALTVPASKNVVLDLNGKTVIGACSESGTSALIRNLGTLTINDSSDDQTGKLIGGADPTWTWDGSDDYSGSYASNLIRNEGTLVVNGGTLYNASSGSAAYAIDNYGSGTVTINGGTVDAKKASAIRMFYNKGGSVTVTDGTIGHYNSDDDRTYMGIQVMSGTDADVDISGGTIAGMYAFYGTGTGDSSVSISGGTFDGYVGFGSAMSDDIAITGGEFWEWVGTWGSQTGFISGGEFAVEPDPEAIVQGSAAVKDGDVWTIGEAIAEIGTVGYATLEGAFAAAANGNTIKLLKNIELTDRLFVNTGATPAYAGSNNRYATTSEDKAVTLDLNGKNITSASNIALAGGSLTVTGEGTISTTSSDLAPIEIRGTGDLASKRTLVVGKDVTLSGLSYGLNVFGSNDEQKNLIDVTVNGTVNGTLFVLGNLKNAENEIAIVVNGTVAATASSGEDANVGIALNGYADVTVSDGASVSGDSGIEVRAGSLTVNGGTITATANAYSYKANGSGCTTKGAAVAIAQHTTKLATTATLNGGTLSGVKAIGVTDVNNDLSGVTVLATQGFTQNSAIPEDYKWVETATAGTYTLAAKEYVAQVGEAKFETLQAAVDGAGSGDTIEIIADFAPTAQTVVNKKVTIDLNGHVVANAVDIWNDASGVKAWSLVSAQGAEADLTVKDTSDPSTGKFDAKADDCYALDIRDGAKLTIESGTYVGNLSAVYNLEGSLAISGGTFDIKQKNGATPYSLLINCHDASFTSGTATVAITGGSFKGFDPSENPSEIAKTPRLTASGYIGDEPDADGWVQVVPGWYVTWMNGEAELAVDKVKAGVTPSYTGAAPTKAPDAQYTYTFENVWTPEVVAATADATYTAVFTETLNTYTVTWKNWNGDVLETDENVPYGTTPTYDGETPERTADAAGTYTFTGWNPGVGPIEGETVYIAQFGQAGAKATVISVADSSQTYFGDLASAVVAAQPGDTVRLLEDAELTATIVIAKDLVIDLNGNDIAATGARALQVKSGNVKITGSGTVSADGAGLVANSSVIRVGDAAANAIAATLVVDTNVVVSSSTCYGVTVFGKNSDGDDATTDVSFDLYGTVSIDTPKVAHGCDAAIAGNGSNGLSPVDVTIHDGATVSSTYSTGVFFPGEGTLAVDGGSVSGTDGIEMRAGTLVVNDGTVTATGSYAAPAANGDGTTGNGGVAVLLSQHTTEKPISATIAGGELVGAKAFVEVDTVASATPSAGVTASITGGTIRGEVETANLETVIPADSEALFTDAQAEGVADGCCLVETEAGSGLYQIATAKASVISVADGSVEYYADLAAAVAAAQSGDTVRLLDDAALTATVGIAKDLVIDLNGKNITATDARALWVKSGTVELTGEGTVSATGTGLGETSSVIRVGDAGTAAAKLTVGKDVTVSTDRSYAISAFGKNAGGIELVVNGKVSSTASGEADAAIAGNGSEGNSPTTITINEGAVVSSTNGAGVFKPDGGTLTIAGGSVTGPTALYVKSGVVNVAGGTLTANGAKAAYQTTGDGVLSTGDAIVVDNCGYPNGAPAVTVSGGTIVSQNGRSVASYAKVGLDPVADIIPGTSAAKFSDADADGVAEGYYLVAVEGTSSPVLYEVAPRTSVIGTVITVAEDAVYDGTTQDANIALVVKPTADGTALVLDTDYVAVFATNALVNAGDYNVKVVGVGAWKDETNVTFKVAKRPATFTGASDTKVYDGTALVKNDFSTSNLVSGHEATATVAGSQTDVGVSSNVVSQAVVLDGQNNDVTANYEFTYVDGELKVTPAAITITVAAVDQTATYTSEPITKDVKLTDAYTLASTDALYDARKVTRTDTTVTGTTVGDYAYGLDAAQFGYDDTNVEATFVLAADGKLTITPASITITVAAVDQTATYTSEPITKDVKLADAYTLDSTDALYDATKVTRTDTTVTGTTVGDYPYGLATSQFGYDDANVEAEFQLAADGKLTITAATVDIPAAPGNKVYNGQNQTADVTAPATVEVTNDGGKDAGDYTVTFALKDTANYTWSDGSVTNQTFGWSIAQKALKLIAEDKEVAHGAAAPAYSYKVDETDGLVEGDSLATEPTLSCAYAAGDAVGTYTIEISGAVAPNYAITYANGTLTVTSNPFTVIWIVDGTQTTDQIEWGTVPVFGGSTDKAADGKYAYAFTGWTDGETQYAVGTALPGVTGAVTYTATYAKTIDTPLALALDDPKLSSTTVSAAAKTATVAADLIGAVEDVKVAAEGATVAVSGDTATASFSNLEWNQGVEWKMSATQTAADDAKTAESAELPGKFYVKPETAWFTATTNQLEAVSDGSDAAVAYTAQEASNEGEMVRIHTTVEVPAGGLPQPPATGTAKVGFAVLQLEGDAAPAFYAYGNGAWTKLAGVEPKAGTVDYLAVYDLAAETPTARYYIDGVALYKPVDGGDNVYALPLGSDETSLKSISFASKEMVKSDIVAEQDVSYVAAVGETPYTDAEAAVTAQGKDPANTMALLKQNVGIAPVSLGATTEKFVVDYTKGSFTNDSPAVSTLAGYAVKETVDAENDKLVTYGLDAIEYRIAYDLALEGASLPEGYPTNFTVETLPVALPVASREGWTFKGWTNNVSENAIAETIPAGTLVDVDNVGQWEINKYLLTVNYLYTNGTVAATQFSSNVVYDTAYSVDSPVIAGYTADKLLVSGTMGAAPVTVDVTYTVNRHTVAFVDENGTVLKAATEYDYGTPADAIAKPETPTKAATAEKVYTFAGWKPAVETVTSNAVYKASYSEEDTKAAVISVAQDGTTNTIYVATIADAIAAAGNGDTIQLIGDVKGDATIEKDVTIDLNGKTWDGDVSVSGEVKIFDGFDGADGKLDGTVAVAEGGSVEVAGGIVNDGITGAGDVVVSGGTVNGGISGSGEIEVSGGTVNGGIVATGEGAVATVKGGTVSGGIAVSGGATGTVTGEDTVVNGDLSGTAETLVVDGGHFEKDPSDYVADGYYADGDDTNGYDVIARLSIEGTVITVAGGPYKGTGYEVQSADLGTTNLAVGTDCTVAYTNAVSGTPVADNVNAGTIEVTVTGIGKWIGTVTTNFVISPATVTVTAPDKSVRRGTDPATLTFADPTYSGFVNGETADVLTTAATAAAAANGANEEYSAASRTGATFPIVASGAVAANYTFKYVDGTLTVVAGAIAAVDGTEYDTIAKAVAAAGKTADGKVITMLDNADAAVALVPQDVLKIELAGFDVTVKADDAYAARYTVAASDPVEGVTTYTLDEIKAKGLMITEFDFEDAYLVYNTGKAEDLAWDSDKAYCTVVTATDLKAERWNVVGGTSTLHSVLGANQDVTVDNLDTSAPVRFFRIAVTPYVLSVDDTVEFAPPAEGGDEP